ncbi:hypothetical protein TNCV_2476531 [Trichonephila clavipes]|nr:hypothetical protein TNCV_2476531 [Trichonephila clavipes]
MLQLMKESDPGFSDITDDDCAAGKTHEPHILEEESSSDKIYEEKDGNICNGKSILDHPFQSKSLASIYSIVLFVANSLFQNKQDEISNEWISYSLS